MLRLKLALDECDIRQKALCEATGFGKTQISLTLSSGKLPANADKFTAGIATLAFTTPALGEWMDRNNMTVADLCKDIWEEDPNQGGSQTAPLPLPAPATLPRLLCDIAGRAVLNGDDDPQNEMIIRLARAVDYLHTTLLDLVGDGAPYIARTEAAAAAILKGERP